MERIGYTFKSILEIQMPSAVNLHAGLVLYFQIYSGDSQDPDEVVLDRLQAGALSNLFWRFYNSGEPQPHVIDTTRLSNLFWRFLQSSTQG